jgi:subtilisin-like proprotein convertase family protein
MKNFTLLFSALLLTAFGWQANAQGDNCLAAVGVTPGPYTADGPATGAGSVNATNADWYSYTPVASGTIDISACSGPDTRLYVYDGTCAALVEIASNDDACGLGSEIIGTPVVGGTTYYFEFDDEWSTAGFDWSFIFTAAATPGDCFSSGSYDYVSNSTMASSLQSFVANTPGDYITLNFSAGSTETGWDYWFINDAEDGSGATIATGDGSIIGAYESTTGEISFYVESDGSGLGTTFAYGLSCSPPPSCPDPSALTATNITSSSADLTWTAGGTETMWDLEYGAAPYAPTGTPTVSGVTNPYNYSGLAASTTYEFYVRADCGGTNGVSAWVGPYSFTTSFACPAGAECATLAAEISTDFDFQALPGTSACPGALSVTIPAGNVIDSVTTFYDMSAVGGGWMAEQVSWLYSPTVGAGEAATSNGAGNSTGTINYNRTGLSFANFAGGTVDFELHAGRSYGGAGCDNTFNLVEQGWTVVVYYSLAPACLPPTLLTSSNITSNSVDLGWTAAGSETMWNIEYGPAGFTPGTGTIVTTGTNPYTLTGLISNEAYDFWIQADCGGDSSSYAGPSSFTTPCAVYTPQYLETYNTWVSACWDQADAGSPTTTATSFGASNWGATGFLNDGSGVGAVKINLYTTGTEDWMVSPTFDLSAGGPWELKIEAGVTGWNNTSAQPMGSDDMVEVVVSTDGGATWSVLHTWDATNQPSVNGEFLQLDLSAYTGTSNIFAIWAYDGTVNDPEDFDFHIGSFEIKEAAADDLAMLNVTTSAATGCNLSNSETVTIQFKNIGTSSQSNFEVGYSVNGTPITPETVAGPIASGDTITYTFTALVDMSIPMIYNVEAYTALSSDVDLSNDSMAISVNHVAPGLAFNDSLFVGGTANGTHGIICTNGLLPTQLDNCYKLSAVVIDSLVHAWDADLNIYLISPNGDTIPLSIGNGGSGADYIGVVFTDTAATSITSVTAGGFAAGGYYSSEDPNGLGSYTGFDPNGMWDLWIVDTYPSLDDGVLYSWHLEFEDYSFTVDLGADAALCSGQDSLMLDAGAGPYTYAWSNMASTQTIVVSDSAVGTVDYGVIVTDSISMCEASDTVSVSFDDCSGVSELSGGTVSVYPNPSNGNFIISLSNISEQVSVQVVDMQGRLIYSQIEGLKVGKENVISLDNVERGVYLISVSSDKGRYTQSIVVE